MSNTARRHHYVSQFYLREFADPNLPNEQLHAIDILKGRHFITTPNNIALQRDFNSINIQGHAVDEIESHLADIEGQAATVLRDIAQNATLPQNRDMAVLIVYAGILAANNPQVRDKLMNIDQEIARQRMHAMVENHETYESCISELGIENPIDYEVMKAFVESENYTVSVEDPGGYYLARVFVSLYDVVLPYFETMQWSLVIAENNAGDFICSDRPVFLFRIVDLMMPPRPHYITSPANIELTMPLNPRMTIYATTPENPFPIESGDQTNVAYINKRMIDAAERHIYCSNLDFKFLDDEELKSGKDLIDA